MAERDPAYEPVRRLLCDEWQVMDDTADDFAADVAALIKAVRDNTGPTLEDLLLTQPVHPLLARMEEEAVAYDGSSMTEAASISTAVSLKRLADYLEPQVITGTPVEEAKVDGPCPECHDEGGGANGAFTCPACGKGVD